MISEYILISVHLKFAVKGSDFFDNSQLKVLNNLQHDKQ